MRVGKRVTIIILSMFCPSNPSNEVDDDGNPIVGGGGLSRRRRRDTTTKARRSSQLLENAAEEDDDDDYDRRRRSLLLLREDTTTMMSSSTSVGPGGKGERGASASSSSAAAVVVGRRGRGGTMATAMSTRGVSTSSSFTTTTTTGEEQAALNIDESKRAKRCKLSLKASKAKLIDSEALAQALQASTLARQALERPRVGKQLLLSMALVRTNPRTPPSCYPAHGTILTDRFHWTASAASTRGRSRATTRTPCYRRHDGGYGLIPRSCRRAKRRRIGKR